MAYFPFYIELNEKICVIVGGGRIAYRKIETLLEFGAIVIVIAPRICDDIYRLQRTYNARNLDGSEQLMIKNRTIMDKDILDADFVIAATDDSELNSYISRLCKENNKLVNVVDVKEECGFIFPAIVKQKDLVVAISTGGNSPAMAAKIRKEIETVIPDYYGELIEVLGEYRDIIKSDIKASEDRMNAYQDMIYLAEIKNGNITKEELQSIIGKYRCK